LAAGASNWPTATRLVKEEKIPCFRDAIVFQSAGGSVRIADSENFKATTMAAALAEVAPGGMRELHWHPNSDKWQYYISGTARMSDGRTLERRQ
jgi:oxalate decarboxylase/phosphoglucose isomerase-like protein (cupin superfamily)